MTTAAKTTWLVNETKTEYEYDRERALRVWDAIKGVVAEDGTYGFYVADYDQDDDWLIALFELLNESLLGSIVFGETSFDQGSNLIERGEDE